MGNHRECFFEYVERRNEETLLEVIRRKILPGLIIMSDIWGWVSKFINKIFGLWIFSPNCQSWSKFYQSSYGCKYTIN